MRANQMTDGRLLNVQLPNVGRRETQLSQIILKNQLNEVQAHLDRKTAEVEELKQKLSKSQDVIATLTGTHLTESQDSIKSRHDSSQGSRHTARSSSPAHELHNVKRPTIDNSTSTTSLSDDDSIEALRTQLQSAQELAAARAAQLAACGEDVSRLRHERERAREAQAAAEAAHAREAARARGLERALRDERALSREKEESAALLQEQLEEAHARGAALCGEARRVVAGVRRGARELQDRNKRQEETICKLRARLAEETGQSESDAPRASETACCSNCTAGRPKLSESGRCLSERTQLMHCTFKGLRRAGSSASEIASCSSAPVARRAHCDTRACPCISWCERRPHVTTLQREVSVEELLERVESARDALQEGQRRWTRPRRE